MWFLCSVTNVSTSKNANADLTALQDQLGYSFRNLKWLHAALTHKSHSKPNNERLEFIGDAVLGYLIGVALFHRDENLAEDALSLMRAQLVRGSSLAEVARSINLAPHLKLGSGERKSGGRQRDSILADAFEAVIGAIHEDGGIQACHTVVQRLFAARIEELDADNLKDAKTRLQELLQGAQMALPVYAVLDVSGADHERRYTVSCEVAELGLACQASASSRRAAEKAAAEAMLNTPALQSRVGR